MVGSPPLEVIAYAKQAPYVPPLVEELYSDSKVVRARITQRSDGHYDVDVDVFVKGNALQQEPSWWSPIDGKKMVTDSLERARELAHEGMYAASSI